MMKLMLALVHLDDADAVVQALTAERISATVVAARGGLLREGMAALLIGLPASRVNHALSLLDRYCQSRQTIEPEALSAALSEWPLSDVSTVDVGGATAFIVSVSRFVQIPAGNLLTDEA